MARHILVFALVLALYAVGPAHADVTYTYIAGASSYTGTSGSTVVSVPLYLQEMVTASGSDQTSLIDRVFAQTGFHNVYYGVSSIGVAVEQTAQSGTTPAQIQGPVIVSPTLGAYNGIMNNPGFTFAPDFLYGPLTQGGVSGTFSGASKASVLYQNVNQANGLNGDNLQVQVALLGTSSSAGLTSQNGEVTNTGSGTDTFGTGKILIGTLSILVGSGTTTFQVEPLANSHFTNPATSTFNTLTNNGSNGTGPGATSLSGVNTATVLAANMFPLTSNTSNTTILLDQSNNPQTRNPSASYDTFNTINSTLGTPTAGPDASSPGSSFLPLYSSPGTVFVFTVAAVPEPSSLALCGLAVAAGAGWTARRRNRKV
jgi:PEP-CTERM motif